MCKVMAIAGIKPEKLPEVEKFVKVMAKNLSVSPDNDGVGYAAITNTGKVFGEKWLYPGDAFVMRRQPPAPKPSQIPEMMTANFGAIIDVKITEPKPQEIVYKRFGNPITKEMRANTVGIILHARNKTIGDKNIENTHPFVVLNDEHVADTALIHNGSIINHYRLTKKSSTCDSETILHEYLKLGMNYVPEVMSTLAETLVGEYASMVLSSYQDETGAPVPYMDIFKSNKYLQVAWLPELEVFVFCTTSYAITETAKEVGIAVEHMSEVKDGFLLRLDAMTGLRIGDLVPFKPSDRTIAYNSHNTPAYNGGAIYPYGQGPKLVKPETDPELIDLKTNFEKNNSDLFTEPYYEVSELTDSDRAAFAELEKNQDSHPRALALVKKTMGIV